MIVLTAVLQAKQGKERELESLLKTLFPKVKQENGVAAYVLHAAKSTPGKFFFYEKYQDQDAYDHHMNTPYLQEVFKQFKDLVSGELQVELYEDIASIAK